jgi:hypothetical protein
MSRKIAHLTLEQAMPAAELRRAHGALFDVATQIAHLGELLRDIAGQIPENDATEIRKVATGARAGAAQAILTAADVIGLAGRLETIAAIYEAEQK